MTAPGRTPAQDVIPDPGASRPATATRSRIIERATVAFAERGVAATSLDGLAADLGLTKQAILYHFGSKDGLVEAVMAAAANRLVHVLDDAAAGSAPGWPRVEAVVRAAFGLAVREPALLALLREVSRLGQPVSDRMIDVMSPLVGRAIDYLHSGRQAVASDRRTPVTDPRLVLVSAYTMVTGAVTEPEVLRAVGLDLDLRTAAGLRRTLLSFLEAALLGTQPTQRQKDTRCR